VDVAVVGALVAGRLVPVAVVDCGVTTVESVGAVVPVPRVVPVTVVPVTVVPVTVVALVPVVVVLVVPVAVLPVVCGAGPDDCDDDVEEDADGAGLPDDVFAAGPLESVPGGADCAATVGITGCAGLTVRVPAAGTGSGGRLGTNVRGTVAPSPAATTDPGDDDQ